MTYLAAWFLLSVLGCAVWFLLTPFLEDDDEYEKLSAHALAGIRPAHGQRAAPDAVEENDAAIGAFYSATVRGE